MIRIVSQPTGALPSIAPRDAAAWRTDLDAALVDAAGSEVIRARLRLPGALVVTTGQQPGLFSGPLYAVHKALACAALARMLEGRWQRPVVPIFWAAGDDHDYVEASSAAWLDASGELVTWSLPPRAATAPQYPMSEEHLPGDVTAGLATLERGLPPSTARDETLAWLERHYQPGVTLQEAFTGAMAELLAPFGVLCLDPTRAAFKRAQAPLLGSALTRATELDHVLAALPDAGTGIAAGDGATLVFVTTAVGRDRLLVDGDGFRARRSGERFTREELDHLLQAEPGRFSANVLLRPVVESALLPTVAYVAGPGEFRYLDRQSAALYPLLGVPRQVPVPRWSGTVVEAWADRLLGRLGITPAAVIDDDGTIAAAMLERDFPADARDAIDALRRQVDHSGPVIAEAGRRIDPVLDRAMNGRLGRITQRIDDIERVMRRHLRRRGDIAFAQYQRLVRGLHPRGEPQERVLTAASFLGRHGVAWLHAVADAVAIWAGELPPGPS